MSIPFPETLHALFDEDTIFHYTRASTALEHILHERRLKLSFLKDTHDPWEYQGFVFGARVWSSDGSLDLLEELKKAQIKINSIIRERYRLVCLCSNPDGAEVPESMDSRDLIRFGFARSRMWSQYAEAHRGVCIAFSKSALVTATSKLTQPVYHGRVSYPDILLMDSEETTLGEDVLFADDAEYGAEAWIARNRGRIFFMKQRDYRDENEFRVVASDPDGCAEFVDVSGAIRYILVGDRFHEAYRPVVHEKARALDVLCGQVTWHHGQAMVIPLFGSGEPADFAT